MIIGRKILLLIYSLCIFLFSIFIRYLEYEEFFLCFNCEEVDNPEIVFDYIIVGCGSAGSILARRLASNKKVKILILEAGKHGNSILNIPSFGLLLQQTLFDWQYTTVPQQHSCFSLKNKESIWPMGRMVGGTGMLNNMIYVRGHPDDFNTWFKDKEGYSFNNDILPYLKKLEQWQQNDNVQGNYGSVYITNLTFSTKLQKYILKAAKELGYKFTEKTENCEEGFGITKSISLNGERWTPAHTLIEKNLPNVIIRTNRLVEQVLIRDNFEAYGVKYSYLGEKYIVKATRGVILSAGVIGSAKILLHSGIGPKTHLDEIGIKTKVNLPVGENLQDHLTTGFDLILLNQSLGIGIEQMLSPFSALSYFRNGVGPWTTGGCEVLAYFNLLNCKKGTAPDLQLMVMNVGLNEDNGAYLRKLVGITDDIWDSYFSKLNDMVTATILPVLLHPKSRGTVRLQDKNFNTPVLIDPNYLTNKYDIDILVKGLKIIKSIVETNSMNSLGATFNSNVFPPCKIHLFDTTDYWRCYVKHLTFTSYHPVGTCKMGHDKDPSSVVNYNYEVKELNNLFIVDGSIMPSLTSGNIISAIYMLAEQASDILKYKDFLSIGKCSIKDVFIDRNVCKIY